MHVLVAIRDTLGHSADEQSSTELFLKVDVLMSMHRAWAAWYMPLISPLQLVLLPLPLMLEYRDVKEPYWEKLANFWISVCTRLL